MLLKLKRSEFSRDDHWYAVDDHWYSVEANSMMHLDLLQLGRLVVKLATRNWKVEEKTNQSQE